MGHTPRECVDWNFYNRFFSPCNNTSHSARVCGLKPWSRSINQKKMIESHSARVCGLKQDTRVHPVPVYRSHSARVCGLKHRMIIRLPATWEVTLRASVWIETVAEMAGTQSESGSHSARVCGLKRTLQPLAINAIIVTLRASVWIETISRSCAAPPHRVTLRASVWIETRCLRASFLPLRVTLRASVWIETNTSLWSRHHCLRHTPRECVDWNEISYYLQLSISKSHSARVCGLKLALAVSAWPISRVTLRASVWIETRYKNGRNATRERHTPRECVDWN